MMETRLTRQLLHQATTQPVLFVRFFSARIFDPLTFTVKSGADINITLDIGERPAYCCKWFQEDVDGTAIYRPSDVKPPPECFTGLARDPMSKTESFGIGDCSGDPCSVPAKDCGWAEDAENCGHTDNMTISFFGPRFQGDCCKQWQSTFRCYGDNPSMEPCNRPGEQCLPTYLKEPNQDQTDPSWDGLCMVKVPRKDQIQIQV